MVRYAGRRLGVVVCLCDMFIMWTMFRVLAAEEVCHCSGLDGRESEGSQWVCAVLGGFTRQS